MATPVGTMARSPGARVTSTVVSRSAPASPGWAYDGSGSSVSSRTTGTGSSTGSPECSWEAGSGITAGDPTGRTPTPRERLLSVEYQERLGVPLRWWVQGTMLVASLWLAVVVALPGVLA